MNNTYRTTKTTVSLINYHFVICPRYRRKIFNILGMDERFKEVAGELLSDMGIEVIAIECDTDHAHLFVNSLPMLSPADIMYQLKGKSSKILRLEFSEISTMKSLWTRSYFVSTAGNVSAAAIKKYVESQKKRYD